MRIPPGAPLFGTVLIAVSCWAAGPASAAPGDPVGNDLGPPVTWGPKDFQPGDDLDVQVTGCDTAPVSGFQAGSNEIFAQTLKFADTAAEGAEQPVWKATARTRAGLEPGGSYQTLLRCEVDGALVDFPLTVKVPGGPRSPSPSDTFDFDFDKVELSTRTVTPGGQLTFTVTCPTSVTAESAAFTEAPEFTESDDEDDEFTATATFKSTLPSVVTIKVTCEDHGSVTFSTQPGDNDIGNGGPDVPAGAPDTGDGSTLRGGGAMTPLGWAAAGLLLAGAGAGAGAFVRRRTRSAENG